MSNYHLNLNTLPSAAISCRLGYLDMAASHCAAVRGVFLPAGPSAAVFSEAQEPMAASLASSVLSARSPSFGSMISRTRNRIEEMAHGSISAAKVAKLRGTQGVSGLYSKHFVHLVFILANAVLH